MGGWRQRAENILLRQRVSLASRLRVLFYRALGAKIAPGCRLEKIRARRLSQIEIGASTSLSEGCWLWPLDEDYEGTRIKVGAFNFFNRDVMIDACNRIEIGDRNMFGPGVYITDSNHTLTPGRWVAESPMDLGRISIGSGCWLGVRAVVLKDVTLGDHCVVAAGAVVTKSFPAGSVVAGVPARLISTRQIEAAR